MRHCRARGPLPIAGAARFLAAAAARRQTVTYAEFARECGGSARGQGARLGALTQACHSLGLPLLPMLVVRSDTRLPTVGAAIYRALGLTTAGAIHAEQRRCFAHDWTATPFARDLP